MTINKWTRARIAAVGGLFLLMSIWVAREAYKLQVADAERFRDLAADNYLREIQIPPGRGRILDRNGKELASTVEVQSVYGNPRVLAHVPGAAEKLARALGSDRVSMRKRLGSRRYFAWLKRRVTPDEEAAVRALALPGVGFRPEPRRFYPLRTTGATVIGYAGSDGRGLEGVERAYDEFLRGSSASVQGLRDALGREMLVDGVDDISASAGLDVQLTMDAYLTMVTEAALRKVVSEHGARAATAIVMDPRTGEILAMASAPTYNPNNPGEATQIGARNRSLTDAFEPGSTMKTFTFAAAFDAGRLRPTDMFDCEMGRMKVGRYTIRDTHPLGTVTAAEAYQQSSNICTTKIARRIGKDALHKALADFGFGARTGIGLPEQRGVLRPTKRWGDIGFANVAFGQGLTATPLQITTAFAAVAAGGLWRPPRLVSAILHPDGRREAPKGEADAPQERRVISQQAAHTMLAIMAGVPTPKGTAKLAAIPGYRVAGKTGTAQKAGPGGYDPDKWLASFIGIVPVEDPQLVVGVFVDEPRPEHLGGKVAAPVFREIAESALKYLNIPPSEPVLQAEMAPVEAGALAIDDTIIPEGPGTTYVLTDEEFFPIDPELPEEEQVQLVSVPNLAGLSIREAISRAQALGLKLVPEGSGVAFRQEPPATRQLPQGAPIHVVFRPGG